VSVNLAGMKGRWQDHRNKRGRRSMEMQEAKNSLTEKCQLSHESTGEEVWRIRNRGRLAEKFHFHAHAGGRATED
jgi:hypothetical protein